MARRFRCSSPGRRYGPAYPVNIATYKLYVYNPSIGASTPYPDQNTARDLSGNANFWVIHWRYFGDPFANPAYRLVYSFRDRKNGSYSYTTSPAEKYRLSRSKSFSYRGAIASVNTSGGVNPLPVYKFMDRKTKVYSYTTSEATKSKRMARPKKFSYRGVAFFASGRPCRQARLSLRESQERGGRLRDERGHAAAVSHQEVPRQVPLGRRRLLPDAVARAAATRPRS